MRLLSIIHKNKSFIEDIYTRNPNLKFESYEEQFEILSNENLGGSEIWSTGLIPLGYQTKRIFANTSFVQKQWALENSYAINELNWEENIARKQIKEFQPEILIVGNYSIFSAAFVRSIRNSVSSIRLIIGWCGSPHQYQAIFPEFDFILSPSLDIVDGFNSKGYTCYHLNLAFDPRVLDKLDLSSPPFIDFSFVGSIIKSPGFHNNRESLLLELIKRTPIEIWSPIEHPSFGHKVQRRLYQFAYDTAKFASQYSMMKEFFRNAHIYRSLLQKGRPNSFVNNNILRRSHPPVFGLPMFKIFRDSKVTLNIHGDITPTKAANMRLYEATGVGTCLLTDWKSNLVDLFEPDSEIVTYRDSEECIEKVLYLLNNERKRKTIAEAGQKRTLTNHTIYKRAEQLDEIIKEELRKR